MWPAFLWLLGLIPLLIAAYVWGLRRRRRFALRYSSLVLVREALPRASWLRRHLPFGLFLLALASLVIALGRPVSIVSVPAGRTVIILAIDVSRSMCATDVSPNRLEAAKAAALAFIERQPASTQIGIVAFAGFAEVIQLPTSDQEVLQDAVESLITGRRTAIGSAILKSIDAIAEIDSSVAPSDGTSQTRAAPVPRGAYAPDVIVVLTDGVSNSGPQPLEAAQQATVRGVRVYTIGFGTANESQSLPNCGQRFSGGDPFGGGGFFGGGGGFRRGIDEAALQEISAMTGGAYYEATSASELNSVFQNLPTNLITRHEVTEISVAFAAIGALLAALAIALSLIWSPLP